MRPLRVLIAEDDALTAMLLNALFARHGFEVIMFNDGQSVVQYIDRSSCVDLVLLDLLLPLVSGVTILEYIRANEHWRHCAIFVLSAKDQLADQRHALALGANAYWVKPFDPDALLASVLQLTATLQAQ